MPGPHLAVALLGGVPKLLGGGGLELQLQRTGEALRALGHDARPIAEFAPGEAVDVVHAFNHGGDVVHFVEHWRRTPAAFVFSPVLVVAPAHEWRTRLGKHLPVPGFPARAIRDLVRKADVTVGLTRWEAAFMRTVGGVGSDRVAVVSNGVDPVGPPTERPWETVLAAAPPRDQAAVAQAAAPAGDAMALDASAPQTSGGLVATGAADLAAPAAGDPGGPGRADGFVLSVGSVSPRKGQPAVAKALKDGGRRRYVVIGGDDGLGEIDELFFSGDVEATGGAWLQEIDDPTVVRGAMAAADALVLLSGREGQSLAVLEALSVGTPVVGSDLPSHRELAAAHPGWVEIAAGPDDLERAISTVVATSASSPRPTIPTWADVATELEAVYRRAMQRPARTGQQR